MEEFNYKETETEYCSSQEINLKSINFSSERLVNFNDSHNNFNSELKEIFEKMINIKSESVDIKSFKNKKLLPLFIRRYRNNISEIIKEFSKFITNNRIDIRLIVKFINTVNKLLIEKNQLINFYDLIMPILFDILNKIQNENINEIDKLINCFEKLISRINCPNIQKLENSIDFLLKKIFDNNIKFKSNSNNLYAIVQYLIIQIKYYPIPSLYKIISKNIFNLFLNLIKYFKHNNKEIRLIISELISVFLNAVKDRDNEAKYYYSKILYKQISDEYITHLKLNANIPNDYNILSGFILSCKKIFLFDSELAKKNYKKFLDDLFKCRNSIKKEIKIEFIKIIPDLYYMNKTIFIEKYIKLFLDYANTLLNIKTKKEIRKQLLLTLGQLSLILDKNDFQVIIDPLISFLNTILNKANKNIDILDDEFFKCLADLLNNEEKFYTRIIFEKFNIFSILPHLFCKPLSLYAIEYLLSVMKNYENSCKENICITIISLNVISLIICDEEMKLNHISKYLDNDNINIDINKVKEISQIIKKKIKFIKEENNKINNIKEKIYPLSNLNLINNYKIITNSLIFLYNITNDLFYKDMFVFFGEKLINLLNYVPNKIYKKIIDLILCKFIKIYEDDISLSQFILSKFITLLKSTYRIRKEKIKIYILDTIIKKNVIIDIILQNKYNILPGISGILISNEEECVKKKYIEFVGILLTRDSDKNYGYIFTQKIIKKLIFELYHSFDSLEQENLSFLFSLIVRSLKNFINIQLIEKILKNIIYINIYNNFNGIIIINLLNLLKELFTSETICQNYNNSINDFCQILFVIYISLLKDRRFDDSNLGILIEVLYYIIKINKIDIYLKYDPNNNFKTITLGTGNKINNLIIDNNFNEESNINIIESKIIDLINNISNQNISELLLFTILKCEDNNVITFILKIFGLCGAIYPEKMEKSLNRISLFNHYFKDEKLEISTIENKYNIIIYNDKFRKFEELNLSNEEQSSIIATILLIQLLKKDFYRQVLTKKIIPSLNTLIKSTINKKSNLIKVLLFTFIEIMPQYDIINQNKLFECIFSIFSNFREISLDYIDSVIKLIVDYLDDEHLDILFKLFSVIFEKYIFHIQKYYQVFINKFIYLLKQNKNHCTTYIKLLILMIKYSNENTISISIYLKIILEELIPEFLDEKEETLVIYYLKLFDEIIALRDVYLYYHIIIENLLKKIKQIVNIYFFNPYIQNDKINSDSSKILQTKFFCKSNNVIITVITEIFIKMNKNQRTYFFPFCPLIIKILNDIGVIKTFKLWQKFNSLIKGYKFNIICSSSKSVENIYQLFQNQCIYEINKNNNEYLLNNYQNSFLDENLELHEENIENKKEHKIDFNNFNIIYKIYENLQFSSNEDWYEIVKTLLSISFENTQSSYLRCCYLAKDYCGESNLMNDLNNHCYYDSVFNKFNDNIKKYFIEKIIKAVLGNKASNGIVMNLLDHDYMFKRNINNLKFFDKKYYDELGKICYKYKAYAKSLCFKEDMFLINNIEHVINLIKLYDKLNIPEAAIGLMKLAKKKNLLNSNEFKDYKCYIYIKDYDYALKLINEKLCHENEKETVKELMKSKEMCLYGLYDWENLLLEDKNENSTNEIKIINESADLNSNSDFFNDEFSDNLSTSSNYNDNNTTQENNEKNALKRKIKKELILIEASIDLCKWDQVTEHLERIRKKVKSILDISFLDEKNNINIDCNLKKNNEENNIFSTKKILKKEKINFKDVSEESLFFSMNNSLAFETSMSSLDITKEKYIPFNELVYKNKNFGFLVKNADYLYDLNLFSSIKFLNEKNYVIAEKYLEDSKKIILNKVKPLLNESYSRCFDLFIKNQEICFMEDIIKYKKYHLNDKKYLNEIKKAWDKIFDLSVNEPNNCIRLLKFFNLILPVEEVFDKYIKLSNICRRFKFYVQSEKILNFIKKRINLNISENKLLNEINIKIDLNHCKCLFEKGELDKALEKSKNLVKLFDDENNQYNKINNILISKVFGEYAIYLQHNFLSNCPRYNFNKTLHYNNKINDFLKTDNDKKNSSNKKDGLNSINRKEINIISSNFLNIKENKNNQVLVNIDNIKVINFYYSLACKYNKNNFKYWNNYTLFNYKCYKFIYNRNLLFPITSSKDLLKKKKINQEVPFAMNTLNGLRNCLVLSESKISESFESALKLIDIFTNSAEENDEILFLISEIFNKVDTKSFAFFFPQLLKVAISNNNKLLEIFIKFIIRIGLNHQQHLICIIFTALNSSKGSKLSLLKQILFHISKINQNTKDLIESYIFYSNELIKSAILLHEEWKEIIEISSNLIINNGYSEIINKLVEMHKKMRKSPESLYEINFHQKYGSELNEADKYLNKYISTKNDDYIKEAYEIYNIIYNRIMNEYKNLNNISLEYICPKLCNNNELLKKIGIENHTYLEIWDPVSFELDYFKTNQKKIFIKKIENNIFVYKSTHHPKKLTYIGTDDKEYKFLLKGNENFMQESIIMQLFTFINLKIKKEKKFQTKDLFIKIHTIIPFTFNIGLISFVKNYDSIYDLINEFRNIINAPVNSEIKQILDLYPKYDSGNLLSKVEILKEVIDNNEGIELRSIIWLKSKNCESYFVRKTNYSRSLAVMSMVGYIIGLGDRHPNNILLDRQSGKLMHIDFGDCFEIAMKRNKYPEKIPFRLTKIFIKALDAGGVEGIFRIISEQIMELLRENKYSLIFILSPLMYIHIVTFRFILPKIEKVKKKKINNFKINSINYFNDVINFSSISYSNNNINMSGKFSKLMNNYHNKIIGNSEEFIKKQETEYNEKKSDDKKINFINEFKENKRKLENEEALLINNFEYQIKNTKEYSELNDIAKSLLIRVINKLNGFDFEEDVKLDIKDQVDRLINQATSIENLAQSFLGWCPFL